MININEGSVKSTIAFYNYGTVGQNEIDHCVGVNNYDDMVIPEMEFTSMTGWLRSAIRKQ